MRLKAAKASKIAKPAKVQKVTGVIGKVAQCISVHAGLPLRLLYLSSAKFCLAISASSVLLRALLRIVATRYVAGTSDLLGFGLILLGWPLDCPQVHLVHDKTKSCFC